MNLVGKTVAVPARICAATRSQRPPLLTPLLSLLILSVLFRWVDIDQSVQHSFWSPATGWFLKNNPAIQFLYRFGTWPALFVGIGSALFWLGSKLARRRPDAQGLALFLALLLFTGPGLIVNSLFKDHVGRSRPVQSIEFGGQLSFQPLGDFNSSIKGKSFPSGHASMGFYWLGLFIRFWNRRPGIAAAFCGLGLAHGFLMGFARMAQGGHWLSDVLWSAGLVYFTAWLLNLALPDRRQPRTTHEIIAR